MDDNVDSAQSGTEEERTEASHASVTKTDGCTQWNAVEGDAPSSGCWGAALQWDAAQCGRVDVPTALARESEGVTLTTIGGSDIAGRLDTLADHTGGCADAGRRWNCCVWACGGHAATGACGAVH